MKNSITLSFEDQAKKAKEILESEVRPQVELYELQQIEKEVPESIVLNPEQKAYLSCTPLL